MAYIVETAPHIRSEETAPKIYWKIILSLLPALIMVVFFFRWEGVKIIGCSVSAAMLAEILVKKMTAKSAAIHDGSSILIGILFAMMSVVYLPLWAVTLGSFVAVLLGKEIFGGVGQNPLNAPLLGQVFLYMSFPNLSLSQNPESITGTLLGKIVSQSQPGILAESCALALIFGGCVLMIQKIIYWETPLIYLAGLWFFSYATGMEIMNGLTSGSAWLVAFYLITDYATTPSTRMGTRIFAFCCGVLVSLLREWDPPHIGIPFALLLMNALTPWLDALLKPSHARGG